MIREELIKYYKDQVEMYEMWAKARGKKPCGKAYEEYKTVLELLEQEPCDEENREKIAEDVANKMDYMGTCLNERNIILGIITGKRETADSLCSICKSESCVSNGTAISKADYEARFKTDMIAILDKLRAEIEQRSYGVANDNVIQGMKYERSDILKILDKYKSESEKL